MLSKAKENSSVVYGAEFNFIKKKFKPAPLQFSDQVERDLSDYVGHLHSRKERVEILKRDQTGNIDRDEFFDIAQEIAHKTGKNGNIVGVLGQPGIGKTTLTETLMEEYANKGEVYESNLVFYLKFRHVDYSKKLNLLKFLAPTLDKDYILDKKRRHALLNKLNNSFQTLIIMDGLDEADTNLTKKNCPIINIYDKQTAKVFIKNILRGTILSKAKKLITSRPRQLFSLPKDFQPTFFVNIIGLDRNAQEQICREVCDKRPEETFGYVQDHPNLSAYCHVPLNCIFVMFSVNSLKTKKLETCDIVLPCTLTGILGVSLVNFINGIHHYEDFVCNKIADLAWKGFENNKICFNESDIREANLTEDDLKNMFVTIFKKPNYLLFYNSEKCTYFCHLVMQEFFAALKLIFFIPIEKLKKLISTAILNDDRFEMVVKFVFGLCNKETFECLKKSEKEVIEFFYPEKQTIFLKKILQGEIIKIIHQGKINDKLIRYFCLVYEMHDKGFTQKIANQLPDRVELKCTMVPTDFEPLHYVFRFKKTSTLILEVNFKDHFYGDCWKDFLDSQNWKDTLIEVRHLY